MMSTPNTPPIAWTAAVMPDDALDPDSLVGRMIHGWEPRPQSPEEVAAGLRQAFRTCIEDGVVSPLPVSEPPSATVEPLPLWRLIAVAGVSGPCNQRDIIAAEIEALRDYLFPSGPPMFGTETMGGYIYNVLTEQAAIARGES